MCFDCSHEYKLWYVFVCAIPVDLLEGIHVVFRNTVRRPGDNIFNNIYTWFYRTVSNQ